MSYNVSRKKSSMKYIKEHQQWVQILYKKELYEEHIKPAIERSGMNQSQFIKLAVEKLINELEEEKAEGNNDD